MTHENVIWKYKHTSVKIFWHVTLHKDLSYFVLIRFDDEEIEGVCAGVRAACGKRGQERASGMWACAYAKNGGACQCTSGVSARVRWVGMRAPARARQPASEWARKCSQRLLLEVLYGSITKRNYRAAVTELTALTWTQRRDRQCVLNNSIQDGLL
jgi:hypothetical protein